MAGHLEKYHHLMLYENLRWRVLKLHGNILFRARLAPNAGLFVFCALLSSVVVAGEQQGESLSRSESISIDRALEFAYEKNPELAAVGWNISIAQGERQQAGLIPNPELSWGAEDTRRNTRTTTVQITQPIELGGKRGARIELAERGQDVASTEVDRKRNALRADVIQDFYGALRAQERLELNQESLKLAERAVAVAEGRIKAGKSSPVEGVRAQVQLSEVRLEVSRSQMELSNAYQQLASTMGYSDEPFSKVQGSASELPKMPAAPVLLGRISETSDMRLASLQINQQEASLDLAKTQRIPDLRVSLGSQYSAEDRERINVVGLSMPIPLFDRNQGNVLAAARRTDQARDLRNAAEIRLRTETQQALDQWSTALVEINSFDKAILPAAQVAVDSATRGFEMGKFNFLEVLDAQRTLVAARTQYIQAIADATNAWVRIERIYGDVSTLPQ